MNLKIAIISAILPTTVGAQVLSAPAQATVLGNPIARTVTSTFASGLWPAAPALMGTKARGNTFVTVPGPLFAAYEAALTRTTVATNKPRQPVWFEDRRTIGGYRYLSVTKGSHLTATKVVLIEAGLTALPRDGYVTARVVTVWDAKTVQVWHGVMFPAKTATATCTYK